jgi:hypothetical protein
MLILNAKKFHANKHTFLDDNFQIAKNNYDT